VNNSVVGANRDAGDETFYTVEMLIVTEIVHSVLWHG